MIWYSSFLIGMMTETAKIFAGGAGGASAGWGMRGFSLDSTLTGDGPVQETKQWVENILKFEIT
jgi:hypothetical protein